MTVSTQTAKSQYTGNGVTTAFTGSFPILDQTHISVILTSTAGVDTTQTLTTDYTVSGVGGSTFTVTFLSAPASGVRVTIARNVPLTQELDLVENDEFPSAEIEKAYDKNVMIAQQVNEGQARSLKIPLTDPSSASTTLPNATERANKVLGFDSNGDPTATTVGTLALGDGDVTTAKLDDNAVTNAKLATVATATFKGRTTAGTGNVEDLTATQATALLNAVVGDSGSGGTKGLVPAPAAGDAAASKFLKADGTWATPTSGALVFLSEQVASSVATLNFTSGFSATYDEYVITFEKVIPATDDVSFYLRVSTDGGSSYQTTSYLSSGVRWNTGGTGAEGRTDGISLSNSGGGAGSLQSNVTSEGGLSGTVRFWPNGSAGRKAFIGESGGISASNGYFGFTVRGTWDGGNTAINGISFRFSSGNIASGNFRLYGVAKS